MAIPILNLLFRGLAIAGRFLVLIGIGRYLSETELGIYGLFYTSIILAIYFIGLDFYTYNTREIIGREYTERLPLLRDQLVFHLLVYLVAIPLLLPVFYYDVIPFRFIIWFYLILIFEHLSQEFFRIFTALSKSVFANFITFIRSGAWAFVLAIAWIMHIESLINLHTIWIAWFLGSFVSVIISVIYLFKLNLGTIKHNRVNWPWIKKGILISLPFFVSSLCFRLIEHTNRYFIDFFQSKDLVGIFTLFASSANLISVIVFTTIIMVDYPVLYEYYIHRQNEDYLKRKKKFIRKVIYISLAAGILAAVLIHPLLYLIGKHEIYDPHIIVFYILIGANILYNLSLIPHYLLYIKKKDYQIMITTLAGLVVSLILNYLLVLWFAITGAALTMLISFFVILTLKWIIYKRDVVRDETG